MTKTKAGPVSADRLKSFVERIEKLDEEKAAIACDIRDVFSEAKGVGYDTATIRWAIKERKMDAAERDERDALRDTYAHALGMAVDLVRVEGLSLRDAAKQAGVSKSSVHRALAVPEVSHDGGTDEVPGTPAGPTKEITSKPTPASIMPRPDAWKEITQSCAGRGVGECQENPAPHGQAPEEKGPSTPGYVAPLPIKAGQGDETAGNVAISEPHPESAPRAVPAQDPSSQIKEADTSGGHAGCRSTPSHPAVEEAPPVAFDAVNPGPPPERVSLHVVTGKGGEPAPNLLARITGAFPRPAPEPPYSSVYQTPPRPEVPPADDTTANVGGSHEVTEREPAGGSGVSSDQAEQVPPAVAPAVIDPDLDDLKFPAFLDVRKRRAAASA
jgi:uncharacterized protein (UPF0335 family)